MKEASKGGGGGHGVATVTVAVRMGAVGMTAAARVATGTAAVMEVVKGLRAEGRGGEDDGGQEGVEEGGGGRRRRRPWRMPYRVHGLSVCQTYR